MQGLRYCTAASLGLVALLGSGPSAWQGTATATPAAGEATYILFLGGREIGREQAALARTPSGWTVTSTGQIVGALDLTNRRFELTYGPDWQPISLKIDAVVQDAPVSLSTTFTANAAVNEITREGQTQSETDQISAGTIVLPNNFYAAYEALAARLPGMAPGADLPAYIAPDVEIRILVKGVMPATFQTPAGEVKTRRYAVTFQNPGRPLDAEITVDERNRFAGLDIPSGGLTVSRQDLAGVATRRQTFRNPTDEDVRIPAAGFGLAGTLTKPTPAAAAAADEDRRQEELPAILLVGGAGPVERDSPIGGIPVFAQLAGQLAAEGFLVLRYDKRGVGQSGGRLETVTLQDYAEDAVAAVKWLARRRDVDDDRIFVLGHGEGASVAMLAAAREKRIAAIVTVGGPGTPGRELILEQQQRALKSSTFTPEQRAEKVELQKQIVEAAVADKGWDALPPEVRRAVDTPYFRSVLTFDPAKVMPRIKRPILIVQGELDAQIPPHHGEKLAALARARKNSPPVELRVVPGLTHSMVKATSGGGSPSPALGAVTISPELAPAIASWLRNVPR